MENSKASSVPTFTEKERNMIAGAFAHLRGSLREQRRRCMREYRDEYDVEIAKVFELEEKLRKLLDD